MKRTALGSLLAVICGLTSLAVGGQASRRPLTPEDLFAIRDIGEVQVSPDGSTVAFTLATTDLAANRVTTRLMTVPARGGQAQPVPGAPEGPSNIRWSPKGSRLAFFASRGGRSAVWVADVATARLTRVCDYDRTNRFLSKAGNALAWSPDGTRLAFAGTTEPAPLARDPLIVSRIQYKTRTSFSDARRSHIFVVPAAGGAPRALTSGAHDEHSIDWGGDGSEIAFLSNHETDPDARLNYDIFAVRIESGAVRRLTNTPGVEFDPHVSPDGRWIAYTATTRPVTTIDSVAEDTHVWVVAAAGGEGRELNGALDRRCTAPAWTPDSQQVAYLVADHGKTGIYESPAGGGDARPIVDRKAQVTGFSVSADGSIVLAMSDPATPREIYRLAAGAPGPERVTRLNAATVAGWRLVSPEALTYKSFDGTEVEGWYYPALAASGRVPMLLTIHGGPHGSFGYAFSAAYQLNAARGYATLIINPRGSSGYGQAFADGCVGDWGGGDYKDLMAGVDHVLRLHPEIDPERLGVTGGSYGGFMTNWVVTQTSRFKAAVAVASVSDLISFYATSMYQDLVHAEFGGFPWADDNFALLWKRSPLAGVGRVVTPTLLIHGEQDNDVHITQAEEMYTALRRRGIDTVLARYPHEGHGFREPKHLLDRTVRTLEWMDRYLKPRG
jgi:dipeptidyl aminopeptidase/acylaminoacyl peptidase